MQTKIALTAKAQNPPSVRSPGPWLGKPLHKELESQLPLATWLALMQRMTQLIVAEILDNVLGFVLPVNLGTITVIKIKGKSGFIDQKALCQTGISKPQRNFHSFGYTYRINWKMASNTNFPNRGLYKFKACRSFNRLLAKHIFAGHDYLPATYKL